MKLEPQNFLHLTNTNENNLASSKLLFTFFTPVSIPSKKVWSHRPCTKKKLQLTPGKLSEYFPQGPFAIAHSLYLKKERNLSCPRDSLPYSTAESKQYTRTSAVVILNILCWPVSYGSVPCIFSGDHKQNKSGKVSMLFMAQLQAQPLQASMNVLLSMHTADMSEEFSFSEYNR